MEDSHERQVYQFTYEDEEKISYLHATIKHKQ